MTFFVCIVILILIQSSMSCSSSCLSSTETKACNAVFSPNAYKMSCCKPMDEFVQVIADCMKKVKASSFTCAVSNCVTSEYKILTNGKIDENKIPGVIKQLNEKDQAAVPLNEEITNNCLNGQYKQYITRDPNCDTMKFQVCAFVNYLNGCQKFNSSPRFCRTLSKNVATCKNVLPLYLKQINNSC